MTFFITLRTEFAKLRRCPIVLVSFAVCAFVGAMLGLFVWIMANPGMAEKLGLIGDKARIAAAGISDWKGLFAVYLQIIGLFGLLLYSMILAFIFGREYAEGTAKNMLVLPIARSMFVTVKFIVAAVWFELLVLLLAAECLAAGALLGLPGFSAGLFLRSFGLILTASLLLLAVGSVTAWVAVATKGYLAPIGFAILSLILGILLGVTEIGRAFPWTVPAIFVGATHELPGTISTGGVVSALAAFAAAVLGTMIQVNVADNTQ